MIAVSVTSAAISTIRPATDKYTGIWEQTRLKKFSSYAELENFVNAAYYTGNFYSGVRMADGLISVPLAMSGGANSEYYSDYVKYIINPGSDIPIDYSTTNIQVDGVDEADIVKSDGKYIYVVSGSQVFIIDAYPAENARILSRIEVDGNPTEIFVNENKLVVLGWGFINVYDISDRENPVLKRDVTFNGYYLNSRMIGNYVYVIVNNYIYCYDENIELPYISSNGNVKVVPATEIYYFENFHDYSYDFTTIIAINAQNDEENITSETFLLGTTQNIFVSLGNIYITQTMATYTQKFVQDIWGGYWDYGVNEKTIIHKISIADGKIEYKSQGEVPGRVLNQFSMDEYQGYLRIATTTGEVWGSSARNNVYVLNEDLNIVGRLEGLAPGEQIYSARFMGNRAYLVTFKKIDPLFVIDLTNPTNPRALGELEIPGYSDYLHPYDETHVIGIGKDAVDMGSFAWYQGVKIALFDVSDPENPKEISSYVIGDRGTNSYALDDHRAFLFSRSKNLLVIPISLAEINEEQYPDGVPPSAYGEHTWDGAYVFNISTEGGLALKGRITHSDENTQPWWYWDYSPNSVKRSLYIENVLYTISDGMIKMNDLADLHAINSIELPSSFQSWPIEYYSVSV
jgi:uncharacterized secreted protein with C-terminal beta-propeller domain